MDIFKKSQRRKVLISPFKILKSKICAVSSIQSSKPVLKVKFQFPCASPVVHTCILATGTWKLGRLWFKASLGKKFARAHISTNTIIPVTQEA